MVNRRSAIRLIEDELSSSELKVLQGKYLVELMQRHASYISALSQNHDLREFETQLSVVNRLFFESDPEIKLVMTQAYKGLAELWEPKQIELIKRKPE